VKGFGCAVAAALGVVFEWTACQPLLHSESYACFEELNQILSEIKVNDKRLKLFVENKNNSQLNI